MLSFSVFLPSLLMTGEREEGEDGRRLPWLFFQLPENGLPSHPHAPLVCLHGTKTKSENEEKENEEERWNDIEAERSSSRFSNTPCLLRRHHRSHCHAKSSSRRSSASSPSLCRGVVGIVFLIFLCLLLLPRFLGVFSSLAHSLRPPFSFPLPRTTAALSSQAAPRPSSSSFHSSGTLSVVLSLWGRLRLSTRQQPSLRHAVLSYFFFFSSSSRTRWTSTPSVPHLLTSPSIFLSSSSFFDPPPPPPPRVLPRSLASDEEEEEEEAFLLRLVSSSLWVQNLLKMKISNTRRCRCHASSAPSLPTRKDDRHRCPADHRASHAPPPPGVSSSLLLSFPRPLLLAVAASRACRRTFFLSFFSLLFVSLSILLFLTLFLVLLAILANPTRSFLPVLLPFRSLPSSLSSFSGAPAKSSPSSLCGSLLAFFPKTSRVAEEGEEASAGKARGSLRETAFSGGAERKFFLSCLFCRADYNGRRRRRVSSHLSLLENRRPQLALLPSFLLSLLLVFPPSSFYPSSPPSPSPLFAAGLSLPSASSLSSASFAALIHDEEKIEESPHSRPSCHHQPSCSSSSSLSEDRFEPSGSPQGQQRRREDPGGGGGGEEGGFVFSSSHSDDFRRSSASQAGRTEREEEEEEEEERDRRRANWKAEGGIRNAGEGAEEAFFPRRHREKHQPHQSPERSAGRFSSQDEAPSSKELHGEEIRAPKSDHRLRHFIRYIFCPEKSR